MKTSAQDIDRRLPDPTAHATLRQLTTEGILEIIASGNTGLAEAGNWRLRATSTTLYIERHDGTSWVEHARHEA